LTLTPVTKVGRTVMALVAVLPPSCVVTVMMALPAAIPVTRPVLLTVATNVLFELQLTVLLVAFEGKTVAVSCCVPFTGMDTSVGLTLTPVTKVGRTVMALVAVLPPSCVVTVMMALPAEIPVTRPVLLTVATDVLFELQLTVLLVAFEGKIVAVSCCVPFTEMLARVGLTLTPVTGIITALTVMTLVAVLPPSCVVTVMMALPAAIPVTRPVLLTVETDVLFELQLTLLLVAFEGETVAVNCCVTFTEMLAEVGLTLTPVTGIVVPPLLSA